MSIFVRLRWERASFFWGKDRSSGGSAIYPFTAPAVTPSIRYRWKQRKTMNSGSMEVVAVRREQGIQSNRECELLRFTEDEHRPQHVVPCAHCAQNGHGSERGLCNGHHNAHRDAEFGAAVDTAGIEQFFRQYTDCRTLCSLENSGSAETINRRVA